MKRMNIAFVIILLVNPCYADKRSKITSVISNQLHDEMRSYRPFVEIKSNFNKITVSLRTFHAAVHEIDKTGRIAEQISIAEGPNVNGFYAVISHVEGKYAGAATYPQDIQEIYWKRYFNVYDLEDSHIVLNYSYGKHTSVDAKEIIIRTIKKVIDAK